MISTGPVHAAGPSRHAFNHGILVEEGKGKVTSKREEGDPLQASPNSGELVCGRHTSKLHVVAPYNSFQR